MSPFRFVGNRLPLRDGGQKVTGTIRYATDLKLPGMLYARLVTSPYAHAHVQGIDVSRALALPGVVAVLTAADLPAISPTDRSRLLLARDRVVFVGQPVALVLATSEAAAEDGAEAVQVEYTPLPAATTIDQALAEDAPVVWPEGLTGDAADAAAHSAVAGQSTDTTLRHPNVANRVHFSRGNVARGFQEADVVVEHTFTTSWVHQSYLEPHAVVVQPDPFSGGATVWSSTQAIFFVREQVAQVLGVPESHVRVIGMPVGGGFGGKFLALYEPLIALAARAVGKPVRLVLTRSEEMAAANPASSARIQVRLGVKKDGTFTALKATLLFDGGCFPSSPVGGAAVLLGSTYQIPHVEVEGLEVLTFKPSAGAYRAPGAPQAFFALESAIDEAARQLQVDPIEIRLRHASRPGAPMIHGKQWPSMGMCEVLEALQRHPAWQEREQARHEGRGVGIAVGWWAGGLEPAAVSCTLNRDGFLQVHVGFVDLSGTTAALAALAAEVLGISPDMVQVVATDTSSAPYVGSTSGSKITYTVGPAVMRAAEEARHQILAIAAEELEADPNDLEIRQDGVVFVRGLPERSISLAQIASKTMGFGRRYAPVLGHGRHVTDVPSPGFCAQLAEVTVDRETGHVQVERLVIVQDVGRAINPLLIEGQMMGGAVQGIGWALCEALIYDEHGQLLTGSWMDYALPRASHVPSRLETVTVEVPSETGPFGARGVGEPPVVPTAAAIANAIADVTGIRLTHLPITPPRILAALRQQRDDVK